MQQNSIVHLKRLLEKRYAEILCYPRYDPEEAQKRLLELEKLGVEALEFSGGKKAFDVDVLGKGYVGIVVAAHTDKGIAALKIRRVDAGRSEMQHEAEMLQKANELGIGPRLFGATNNFLLMEFIEGQPLPRWTANLGHRAEEKMRQVLRSVLQQCWRLDSAGLDHGELSQASKHILVSAENLPYILDFENASVRRRVSNVTAICHYLFLGGQLAEMIRKNLGEIDTQALVEGLKAYKLRQAREDFETILMIGGLDR